MNNESGYHFKLDGIFFSYITALTRIMPGAFGWTPDNREWKYELYREFGCDRMESLWPESCGRCFHLATGNGNGWKAFWLVRIGNSFRQVCNFRIGSRTSYYVALTNSKAPEGAEKYNWQKFTAAGMPSRCRSGDRWCWFTIEDKEGMADDSQSSLIFNRKRGWLLSVGRRTSPKAAPVTSNWRKALHS